MFALCVGSVTLFRVLMVLEPIPAATGKQNTHGAGCNKSAVELLINYYNTAKLAFYAETQ